MSSQAIFNSHNTWFNLLSYTKLNELFQRASWDPVNRRVLLQEHIHSQLPKEYCCKIKVSTTFTRINKNKHITSNICSIYIKILLKNTDTPIAHFTIHFFKHKETNREMTGRIHSQNNKTQRRHVIRINKNADDNVRMSITAYPNKPSDSLEQVYSTITNIMSLYTTYGNPFFLGIPLTSMSINRIEHPCIKLTEQEWKTSKTPLRHTRKAKYGSSAKIRFIQKPN